MRRHRCRRDLRLFSDGVVEQLPVSPRRSCFPLDGRRPDRVRRQALEGSQRSHGFCLGSCIHADCIDGGRRVDVDRYRPRCVGKGGGAVILSICQRRRHRLSHGAPLARSFADAHVGPRRRASPLSVSRGACRRDQRPGDLVQLVLPPKTIPAVRRRTEQCSKIAATLHAQAAFRRRPSASLTPGTNPAASTSQACPASRDRKAGSMPILFSARWYFVSTLSSKSNSGSASQCSQPFDWISASSWPAAQPA